jgi:hypothetical protein
MMQSLAFTVLFLSISFYSVAQEKQKIPFRDSLDGAIDASYFLASKAGFIPIVMPITEPAVGYGAGGGLIFVHRDMEALRKGEPSPPSLSVVGGMFTENGSWGVFGLHSGVWKDDRIRYIGAVLHAPVNLTFYPPNFPKRSFDFNLRASGTVQQIAFRLGRPKVFAGLRYQFFTTTATFDFFPELEIIEPWETENRIGQGGPVVFVDYRDNTFTPNKGIFAKLTYSHADTWLGSEVAFDLGQVYATWFIQPTRWWVSGFRADYQVAWGEVPFYAKPFVNLRGIPLMRYQDHQVLVFEADERFDLTARWSLTAFAGVANAFDPEYRFDDNPWVYNYGGGFRYKIARLFGAYTGIDFGFGPGGDWAFYIMFGHAWMRL